MVLNRLMATLALAVIASLPASAQTWPARHITMIVTFGPGSGSDIIARILSAHMAEDLGQAVVVENVGGAGGTIGAARAAKADADGYTILLGGIDTMAQSQSLYKNPPYNPVTDFVPILLAAEQPMVLLARNSLPATNMKELAAYMLANADKMQFGSSGLGSAPHLACSQLAVSVGAKIAHVPYRGSAPALQDMLSGNLDLYCPLAAGAMPLMEAKSIKALAVLTQERSPLLPGLPTAREQGFPNIDGYYWMGFFAPTGTPVAVIARLALRLNKTLDKPAVEQRLRETGTTIMPPQRRPAAYFGKYVVEEIAKWAPIIRASGVVPN